MMKKKLLILLLIGVTNLFASKKKEGNYFTGLPLINSDPDAGIGYGVRLYWYDNGKADDIRYTKAPYLHRVYAQYFSTTKGRQYHRIDWDAPYIASSNFRVRAALIYEDDLTRNFFGSDYLTQLSLSGPEGSTFKGKSFKSFASYDKALRNEANGEFKRYNSYNFIAPTFRTSLEYELPFNLRPFLGVQVSYVTVKDFDGNSTDEGSGVYKTMLATKKDKIIGYKGGSANYLKTGITWDTRDFEPNPTSGGFSEFVTEFFPSVMNKQANFGKVTLSQRFFYTPFKVLPVTLASRALFGYASKNTPFWSLSEISFTDENQNGLGGLRSLRGYKQDRFVSHIQTLANFEIRTTIWSFDIFSQNFQIMLVPFIDLGRVFDNFNDMSFKNWKFFKKWKFSYGAGLRIPWNKATVLIADFGHSDESWSLYINFNHIF